MGHAYIYTKKRKVQKMTNPFHRIRFSGLPYDIIQQHLNACHDSPLLMSQFFVAWDEQAQSYIMVRIATSMMGHGYIPQPLWSELYIEALADFLNLDINIPEQRDMIRMFLSGCMSINHYITHPRHRKMITDHLLLSGQERLAMLIDQVEPYKLSA